MIFKTEPLFEMRKHRILFVAHEMDPYVMLTDVARIARALPQAIQEKGMEIRVLMPRYGLINERRHRLHEVVRLSGINVVIGDNDNPLIIKVASLPQAKMQVYFLDNEDYFQRKYSLRDANEKFFEDNHERMIFFNKGVLDTVVKLGWSPDIIHCNGWMTSLIPLYIRKLYHDNPIFKDTKVVYSVYGSHFEECLPEDFISKACYEDMTESDLSLFTDLDCNAMYRGGATFADAIVIGQDNIDPTVLSHVHSLSDKPILMHQENEQWADHYFDLYQRILSNQSVLI